MRNMKLEQMNFLAQRPSFGLVASAIQLPLRGRALSPCVPSPRRRDLRRQLRLPVHNDPLNRQLPPPARQAAEKTPGRASFLLTTDRPGDTISENQVLGPARPTAALHTYTFLPISCRAGQSNKQYRTFCSSVRGVTRRFIL